MSEYQVIARKWRPQRFADVVGQQHVVRTLRNAIMQNRIAHAYLFVGPRGVGKTTLARIFAKALNCLDPHDGEPCCKCESCRAISEERSLDVMEVDAASRNTTGDMRELAEDVLTRPVGGRYKIYIIDEVHMLSKQAWNVLLKTVEEPPAHVKFIFATTEVHQVLPTIISRCQRFDLLPIPTRLIAERLRLIADTEKVAIEPAAIDAIARAAEGGMRDAQSLLDQMLAFFSQGDGSKITGEQVLSLFGLTDRADLEKLLVAMLCNHPGDAVSVIGKLSGKGKNLETLFDDLLDVLRSVQLCALLKNPGDLIEAGPEELERFGKFAAMASPETLQLLLETIAPVGRVLHDALNKQVYLETIILKAMREAHAVRLDDVLKRLRQLRTAGELKFMEAAPAVDKKPPVVIQIMPSGAATETVAAVPSRSTPAPAVETASKPKPEAQADAGSTSEDDRSAEAVTGEFVASAAAEPAAVEVRNAADPVETAEPSTASENPAAVPPEIIEDDIDDNTIPLESETDVVLAEPPDMAPLPVDEIAGGTPNLEPDHTPGGKHERRSIANTDPEALIRAAREPQVKDILDLFGGQVIDIHK